MFLKNMNDFVPFNNTYSTLFNEALPARSAVEVARLPKDVLVEVEIIAAVKEKRNQQRIVGRPHFASSPFIDSILIGKNLYVSSEPRREDVVWFR